VPGEVLGSERRPGCGRGRGEVRWGVHGEVDEDPGGTALDDQPAERVAVMDPLGAPPSLPGRSLKGVTRGGDVAALGGGEEVKVLGGPGREVLGEQGRSPASRKPLLCGRPKNSRATSSWNAVSSGLASAPPSPLAIRPPPARHPGRPGPTRT
jgi:hypothetical protein